MAPPHPLPRHVCAFWPLLTWPLVGASTSVQLPSGIALLLIPFSPKSLPYHTAPRAPLSWEKRPMLPESAGPQR